VSGSYVCSLRPWAAKIIVVVLSAAGALACPARAADGSGNPGLLGQWGRDMLFFEPPPAGPGPVVRAERKADGTTAVVDPCCAVFPRWLGDYKSPILKPAAAAAVKKFGDLAVAGAVTSDLHNTCWPEPPPYVMGMHFGLQILQLRDEVTLVYLLHNTVRRVRLNTQHPDSLTPSWQGNSVGWYEGGTLVVDTVGIKVAPLSMVDAFGTPHSKALHVVERYRLIDGKAAADAQRKNGAIDQPIPFYGRGAIDPDTAKDGLQIDFTVEDEGVFTTPWSGRVTYRRLIGGWPEALCAENPYFLGMGATMPTADTPDF
jgi:hypothetical protein